MPKNTPVEIIDKLNKEINVGLADPKMKARLVELGADLAVGAAALPAVSRVAKAQTYPTRPITVIVPYAAGEPGYVLSAFAVLVETKLYLSVPSSAKRSVLDGYAINIAEF